MRPLKFAVFAFVLTFGALTAAAQSEPVLPSPELIRPGDPESGPVKAGGLQIADREKIQQKRIADGVRTGELTNAEAALLLKRQAEIEKLESDAMADGVMTDEERIRIHRELNKTSRIIRRKRKN